MSDKINFDDVLFADFHIHSRFSRACSTNINFENLVKWARIKGINILGTGDFTHPLWLNEIKENLKEKDKSGFYYYKEFPFIITGEISLVYTQDHGRRIHLVLLVPNIETAERINLYLDTRGRRDYDGRPIFNIPGDEFVREMMKISEDIEIIPAHIWTPWFGIFGSMSGFDSLKECFKEQINFIHAIETGMSSDPEMNWRIKELEDKAIVSFSDAHSFWPFRLGREATIFRKVYSYAEIIEQIRNKTFLGTIETDPAYGKYHWDGHRNCSFSCSPEESRKLNGVCPVCHKLLTIGVDNRVGELASFPEGHKIENGKFYYKILPLQEIISLFFGTAIETKTCWNLYNPLSETFGNEFNILLNISKEEFEIKDVNPKLIDLILKNREGKIKVKPGYDGEYGTATMGEIQGKLF